MTAAVAPEADLLSSQFRQRSSWQWGVLAFLLLGYTALFFRYYPPIPGIEDEIGFINQGAIFSHGSISAEGAGFHDVSDFVEVAGRHVSWRNPGRSLLIVPFWIIGGVHAIYASGLVIHIAIVLVGASLFQRLIGRPLWAVLLLCHPTLAIYSRTIMGDAPAGLFLLAAVYAATTARHPGRWAGLWVGVAAIMRYQAGIVLPFIALAIAFSSGDEADPKRRRLEGLTCLIAGGAVAVVIVIFNLIVFHNPIGWSKQGYFSAQFILPNLIFYTQALCVLWPLMLVAPFFCARRLRWAVLAVVCPVLLTFVFYYFHDKSPSFVQTLVLGQRLIQPAIPAWVIAYGVALDRLLGMASGRLRGRAPSARQQPRDRAIAIAGCLLLLVVTAGLFRKHQEHLLELRAAQNDIAAGVPAGSVLVANSTATKLFGVVEGTGSRYQLLQYDYSGAPIDNRAALDGLKTPFYLAVLPKAAGGEIPDLLNQYIQRYSMTPLKAGGLLKLYVSGGTGVGRKRATSNEQ